MMPSRRSKLLISAVVFGYAFLYLPISILMIYSFNENQLVSVWSHFSPRWYVEVFKNQQLLQAARLSLQIAAVSATIAVLIGTTAAFALQRCGHFVGRSTLQMLVLAPLVLPEVLIGLALLLFFVWLGNVIGWPQYRGVMTITIAHATIGIAYATVVIRARLSQLDPTFEEAAADLGATPWRVFRRVTFPLVLPAVGAAWLLAFTLSVDDVVVASFVTGPGASTLPIVVFASVRLGVSPQVNALATLLIVFVGLLLAVALPVVFRNGSR